MSAYDDKNTIYPIASPPLSGLDTEEANRLRTLHSYQVLDTPAEAELDALTQLAAFICQTPIALISLLDTGRQWFKSHHGLPLQQTDRCMAFCEYTIQDNQVLEVADAHQDGRFKDNPLVVGAPYIRYYCGAPLQSQEGYRLGSLCVIDSAPRLLSEEQKQALQTLAREVIKRFELNRQQHGLRERNQVLAQAHQQVETQVQLRTRQLQQSNAELLNTQQELHNFLYRASHDLMGPIATLKGLMTVAGLDHAVTEPYLRRFCECTDVLQQRLTSLLEVMTINQLRPQYTRCSLPALVGEVIEQLSLSEKIEVEVAIPKETLLCTDAELLKIALNNVLTNIIHSHVPTLADPAVQIELNQISSMTCLRIRDKGISIPTETLPYVFTLFYRNTTRSDNTGLSLFIARKAVEKLGGKISVEQNLDQKETIFCIHLPKQQPVH